MSKKEVVDAVSDAIENQAWQTMSLRLSTARTSFDEILRKLGALFPKTANMHDETKQELTTITDFLLQRTDKETVWEECKGFRQKITDEIVQQWAVKKR